MGSTNPWISSSKGYVSFSNEMCLSILQRVKCNTYNNESLILENSYTFSIECHSQYKLPVLKFHFKFLLYIPLQ